MRTVSGAPSRVGAIAGRCLLAFAALLVVAGCTASKVAINTAPDYSLHSVHVLAIAPSPGSGIANAVGGALSSRGYTVTAAARTTELLAKYGILPKDGLSPAAMDALGKEGVDAVVSVVADNWSAGGPGMSHVTVTVVETRSARQIGSLRWDNARGGLPYSPADFVEHKGVGEAAQEIADAVAKMLG